MNKKLIVFAVFSLLIISSCTNQKKNLKENASTNQLGGYKQIAKTQFGSDTIFILSPEENFVLCKKTNAEPSLNPNALTEFFVYDIKNNKVIYKDKIAGANISWNSNTELLIIEQRGIITTPEDHGKISYLYNLKTNKKETYKTQKNTD